MSKTYIFTWNNAKLSSVRTKTSKGLVEMALDISNQTQRNAPVDTGALVSSVRVNADSKDNVYVLAGGSFGSKKVPYARIHEYGGSTGRNHATHIVGKKYMTRAFDQITANYSKYFRGITS